MNSECKAFEPTALEIDVQHPVAEGLPTVEQDLEDFHGLQGGHDGRGECWHT